MAKSSYGNGNRKATSSIKKDSFITQKLLHQWGNLLLQAQVKEKSNYGIKGVDFVLQRLRNMNQQSQMLGILYTMHRFSNQTTLFSSSLDGTVNAYDTVKYRSFRKFKTDRNCQLTCLAID